MPGYNFEVYFDKPLLPGGLHPPNWRFSFNGLLRTGLIVNAVGSWVVGSSKWDGFTGPENLMNYVAFPPDLFGQNLLPVAPFYDLPII